jgi:hypothetical protein
MADATYPQDRLHVRQDGVAAVPADAVLNIESGGELQIDGTAITATAAEINAIAGGGLSAAELGFLNGATAGTVVASKAVVVGADKNIDTIAIADGGLKLGAGAGTAVTATAAELNKLDGAPLAATFAIGADAGGTISVGIQLQDGNAADLAVRGSVFAYLSNDANGDAIATTAPDGGWAIGTDGLLIPVVAGKAAQLVSEADGDIDITITESGTATWYLILVLPNGKLVASTAIALTA